MAEIVINGRFRRQRLTGTQRVAAEIARRLKTPHVVIEPQDDLGGGRGHAWEQCVLPLRAKGRAIWAPCNTGPLAIGRQIVTIHDAAVLEHPEWFAPNFARFYGRLLPLLAKRVDRIVTVSEFSRARLSERLGLSPDRIEVIWNGVGETFRPTHAGPDAPLPPTLAGRPYFTTLFTQEPRKNLALVLAAWRLARPHLHPDTVLAIIGGKGSASVFGDRKAGAEDDEGIVRCGYLPDAMLPVVLSAGLGLIYPSLYEGFGLPALEAMACGSPVVVTRLTSLPEICGDAALYVDARDPEDLAATLRRLADDPALRADLGRRGRERASLFSWDRAASRMDALLASYA